MFFFVLIERDNVVCVGLCRCLLCVTVLLQGGVRMGGRGKRTSFNACAVRMQHGKRVRERECLCVSVVLMMLKKGAQAPPNVAPSHW